MNVVAHSIGVPGHERHVRAGFRGLSDVIDQLRDGRFLAIEVKRPGGRATTDQLGFLDRVRKNGGLAVVVQSVDDVMAALPQK